MDQKYDAAFLREAVDPKSLSDEMQTILPSFFTLIAGFVGCIDCIGVEVFNP